MSGEVEERLRGESMAWHGYGMERRLWQCDSGWRCSDWPSFEAGLCFGARNRLALENSRAVVANNPLTGVKVR